jgi:predicted O-linked N-acetylglucosamine transferase (SPINDLY family)
MNYTELIAPSEEDYMLKAVLLLTDDDYYQTAKHQVRSGFQVGMRKNVEVSGEWLEFIYRALAN